MADKEKSICFHCAVKEIETEWIAGLRHLDEAGLLPQELREMLAVMADPAVSAAVEEIYREEMKSLPPEKQVELLRLTLETATDKANELITKRKKGGDGWLTIGA
jgi:hypothetical protein